MHAEHQRRDERPGTARGCGCASGTSAGLRTRVETWLRAAMRRGYERAGRRGLGILGFGRCGPRGPPTWWALAVAVAIAVAPRSWWSSPVAAGALAASRGRRGSASPSPCSSPAAPRCARTRRGPALAPDRLGPFHGWVTVVGDPAARRPARRGSCSTSRASATRCGCAAAPRQPARRALAAGDRVLRRRATRTALAHDRRRGSPGSTSSASSTSTGSATSRRAAGWPSRRTGCASSSSAAPSRCRADRAALARGPRHRRRPRRAAGDGRPLPRQRACPTSRPCRARTWRSCWPRPVRCCAGPGRSLGGSRRWR